MKKYPEGKKFNEGAPIRMDNSGTDGDKLFNLERSYSPITNKVLLSYLQIIYSIRPLTIICINWYDSM
jgi:hypothetical protein